MLGPLRGASRRRLARAGAAWRGEDGAAAANGQAIARGRHGAGSGEEDAQEMLDKMWQMAARARQKMSEMRAARQNGHAA